MSDDKKIGWLSDEITNEELLRRPAHRRGRLGVARLGAEVASIAMLPLTTAIGRTFFPHQMDALEDKIAKSVIEPNLEQIEMYADRFTAIEGAEGSEKRSKMTREEKAQYFAHGLVLTAFPAAFSLMAQGYTQDRLDHHFGLPGIAAKDDKIGKISKLAFSVGIDKTIQMGSFIALNSPGAGQNANIAMQEKVSYMLAKLPFVDDASSKTAARWTTNWIVPNFMGMGASIGTLDKAYVSRLKELVGKEESQLSK